jgi:hypothetical protein
MEWMMVFAERLLNGSQVCGKEVSVDVSIPIIEDEGIPSTIQLKVI